MNKKILYGSLIAIYICIVSSLSAQSRILKIGDRFPDIEMSNVLNSASGKIRISNLNGKWIILDFWSLNCISCIRDFPHLDSLQEEFNGKLQIVMVNQSDTDSTIRFFEKRKKIHKPSLPLITSDTTLNKLFPHKGVPFHVWIDTAGKVRYLAASEYTTSESITKVMNGTLAIPTKKNAVYKETLFDSAWKNLLRSYSYISKADNLLHLESGKQKGFELITLEFASISQLYQTAFDGLTGNKYNFSRRPGLTILYVKNPAQYIVPKNELTEWREEYGYNYQLCIPEEKKDRIYGIMKQDLDRYFDLDVKIEKRKVKCYVLIRTSNKDKLKTKGGEKKDTWDHSGLWSTKSDSDTNFSNQPFNKFSSRLGTCIEYFVSKPFIDETGYKGNVDIQFKDGTLDPFTVSGLKKLLKKYDLDLVEKDRLLNVLVIREKMRENN